jgi:large subunit ribosomal protein L19
MHPAIAQLETKHRKPAIPKTQSGDTVRVHQLIREGNKQRIQVFEGVVIRTDRMNSTSASITVRRIASGIGVEKTFLLHSPNIDKVEVMRRGKVRRNFLSYLRDRRGKSARLKEVAFDRNAVNATAVIEEVPAADPIVDQVTDEELTEVNTEENQDELNQVEVSTEELAKEEGRAAAADEPKDTDGGTDEGDESVVEQTEAESGVERAEPNKQ